MLTAHRFNFVLDTGVSRLLLPYSAEGLQRQKDLERLEVLSMKENSTDGISRAMLEREILCHDVRTYWR